MEYHAILCNTMQYHASFITADGAYHCPVGSIRPFLKLWSRLKWTKPVEGIWAYPVDLTLFFGNYVAWVDSRIVLYDLEFFHSILIFCHFSCVHFSCQFSLCITNLSSSTITCSLSTTPISWNSLIGLLLASRLCGSPNRTYVWFGEHPIHTS